MLIKRVVKLQAVISEMYGARFWGASLLLIYEGDTSVDSRVDVRIIDFAHFYEEEEERTVDAGILKGLRNLISILKRIDNRAEKEMASSSEQYAGCYIDVFPDE